MPAHVVLLGYGNPSRGDDALRPVHHLVTTVDDGDAMVVIRTLPGGAPAVAAAIDASRPPTVLGTLAGALNAMKERPPGFLKAWIKL